MEFGGPPPFDAGPMGDLGGGPMPPSAGPPPGEEGGGGDTISILQEMLQLAQEYLAVEEDEEDKLTMTKVLSQLQSYLAAEQKEKDEMLGGKLPKKLLRGAVGGPAAS
jgi:hypothetical protein